MQVSKSRRLVENPLMLRTLLWKGLYGALSAVAIIVSRRAATGIWRTLTGEDPPTKR
jgi:hypothetical protein